MKRLKYSVSREENRGADKLGSALGPDWHKGFSKKVGLMLAPFIRGIGPGVEQLGSAPRTSGLQQKGKSDVGSLSEE